MASQLEKLKKHFAEYKSINLYEAWECYNIRSLPRRIKDLKDSGYKISKVMKRHKVTGQKFGHYYIND